MNKNTTFSSRRKFIKNTLKVAAVTIVPRYVLGGPGYTPPSDQVVLGHIGTGKLSHGLAGRFMDLGTVKFVAGCDVDSQKLDAFTDMVNKRYAETSNKSEYKGMDQYRDYNELIERDDIDAVIISTPDHWHAKIAIDAMNAGKDIYCEKPMAHTVEEGRRMVEAARKNNRVFQTGSMQRSWEDFHRACELVRNGIIGEIKTIKVNVGDPAVHCDLPEETQPEYLDWDRWLGPAPMRPYNSILSPPITFTGWPDWRKYWEYGGGGITDWGAHMFDIAQWGIGMDDSGPVEFIPPKDKNAVRGMKYLYKNGVEMFHEDFGRGWAVEFIGTDGTIRVSRSFLESYPEKILMAGIPANGEHLYKSVNHYQNWIDCIHSRKKPICDVEVGHRTATVCNITNIAYKLNRPLKWDPVKEKFTGDNEANELLKKKYRKPYSI